MYDISQNPFYLYSVHRTSVSGERSGANGPLVPSKPMFSHVCSMSLLKTLLEKEKLLNLSNFCFAHGVFHPLGKHSTIFI